MSKDRDFLRAFSGEDRMTAAQVADKLEQCARQNRLTHTMFLTTHQRCIAQQVVVCCGTPPHRIMGGHPDAERCLFLFLPDYMDADNIPEEELPFVKQKFYKGSSKARGSGIGLAVCDEIVRLHGGTFDIANAEGGGAVVTISLPMS